MDDNEVLHRFGTAIHDWIGRERRTAMSSPLFDLKGRTLVGFAVAEALMPDFVALCTDHCSPEELAGRMRRPLMRPYILQVILSVEAYLLARQERLLEAGATDFSGSEAEVDAERSGLVLDWFARLCGGYHRDGELFPHGDVITWPILADHEIARLASKGRVPDSLAVRAKRALGLLELYAVVLHGELRDGLFLHGPYSRENGEQLVLAEVNDLSNHWLPWSDETVRLPVDAVGALRSYDRTVTLRFDVFTALTAEPASGSFELVSVWAREGDDLRPLGISELEQIAASAAGAIAELHRRMAGWPDSFRTRYGGSLMLNHLIPLAELAGVPDADMWLRERAAPVIEAATAKVRCLDRPSTIWSRLADPDPDLFSPLR